MAKTQDLQELVDLIAVRQYVVNSTGNPAINKETVNYLSNALLMIDKKIVGILQSDDFKNYINFQDIKQAISEVRQITNIKSGLK